MILPPADDADSRAPRDETPGGTTRDDATTTADTDAHASPADADTHASPADADANADADTALPPADPETAAPDATAPGASADPATPPVEETASLPVAPERRATSERLPTAEPVTLAAADPAPSTAAGQHAAPRPYPPVTPATSRAVGPDQTTVLPDAVPSAALPVPPIAAPTAPYPGGAPAPDPAPAAEAADTPPPRPVVPDLPRRPGAGRHLLGVVVGLLLTPVGLVLAAMGVGHMVDLPAGDGALTDPLGLTQLALGALVLGAVAYLGRWSPAVPITGGVLWGLGGGGLALWDPAGVGEAVHEVTDGRFAQVAIDHILQPAQTGSLLVVGVVLLAAGVATGRARRSGRLFGVGTTLAQAARA